MRILEINNLNKTFKHQEVLKNICLNIDEGEIVALIGPNGSGKTTLMKIISGLLKPDSGTIKLLNLSINDDMTKYLSYFSSIIETPSLYETLTGLDNINFIRKLNNVSNKKMDEIIEFINIGDSINKRVKNYSLGMKQRLALGIALLTEPKLLILDEPTNGLDPEGVIEFRELLKKISKNKKTSILISSHILSELDKICTRILFIKDKQLIEETSLSKSKDLQTIILTSENTQNLIQQLNDILEIDSIFAKDDKVYIKLNKSNTSKVISSLTLKSIEYSNIEILNNSTEQVYTNLYLGGSDDKLN